MSFLGEKFYSEQINPQKTSNINIYLELSGHERLAKPIRPTSIGKWKDKLSPEEISIFEKIAGCELESLGYAINK